MAKFNQLKKLLSHQNSQSPYEITLEKALDLALEKLDPEKRAARRLKRKQAKPISLNKSHSQDLIKASPIKEETFSKRPPTKTPTKSLPTWKVTTRHIPQALRDKIWLRDHGKCAFRDPKTGKICGSDHRIQIDHHFPFALGGEHDPENLALRCQRHNLYQAREVFDLPFPQRIGT